MEDLSHVERMRAISALGRAAARGDESAGGKLLDLIDNPNPWRRWLGVMGLRAGGGGCDFDKLRPLLTDASRMVRRAAWEHLAVLGDEDDLVAELEKLGDSRIGPSYAAKALKRGHWDHRSGMLEKLVLSRAREVPSWIDVIPYLSSSSAIVEGMQILSKHGSHQTWNALARRHPRLVVDRLLVGLKRSPRLADHDDDNVDDDDDYFDDNVQRRSRSILPYLVKANPEAAIDLIEVLVDVSKDYDIRGIDKKLLRRIASFFPCRVFDLLRKGDDTSDNEKDFFSWQRWKFNNAERLGAERICWALSHSPGCLPNGRAGRMWFGRLSEMDQQVVVNHFLLSGKGSYGAFLFAHAPIGSFRDSAYSRWRNATRNDEGIIQPSDLDDLPWDLRESEARYHLYELPTLQSESYPWVDYARLLPWKEAESVLQPHLEDPDGEVRSSALNALIRVMRHDRDASPLALAAIRRRTNEQDRVRSIMLSALSQVPRARIANHLIPEVVSIIEDALDAADLSFHSASHATKLFPLILRWDHKAGTALLNRFMQVRGCIPIEFIRQLSKDEIRLLDPTLSTTVDGWVRKEKKDFLSNFIESRRYRLLTSRGDYLRLLPATLKAFGAMCHMPGVSEHDMSSILRILATHDRDLFRSRVLELLSDDHSVVAIPAVVKFLKAERTDLLDPFLDGKQVTGRFATGRTRWVLDLGLNLQGLSPSQQIRYGASLCALLDDPENDISTARWAVLSLASLTCLSGDALVRYSSDPRIPVRDLAIRALSYLDGVVGFTALLDCMGDDRSRVAIHALRTPLAEKTPSEVFEILKTIPLDRVTVAKEVVRLMGMYGGMAGRDYIIELGAQKLHRDVFIALLRVLCDHLDYLPALDLFEKALSMEDPIIISQLATIRVSQLSFSTESDKRISVLFAEILQRATAKTRTALLSTVSRFRPRDIDRTLFRALIENLGADDPGEAAKTLDAILDGNYDDEVSLIAGSLERLVSRRPHIRYLVRSLVSKKSTGNQCSGEVMKAMAPILLSDAITAELGLCVLANTATTEEVGNALVELADRKLLHYDVIRTAIEAKSLQGNDYAPIDLPFDRDMLSLQLQKAGDPRLRQIALANLQKSASSYYYCGGVWTGGWSAERRDQLKLFQLDPSVEVSAVAAWVFPPPENCSIEEMTFGTGMRFHN